MKRSNFSMTLLFRAARAFVLCYALLALVLYFVSAEHFGENASRLLPSAILFIGSVALINALPNRVLICLSGVLLVALAAVAANGAVRWCAVICVLTGCVYALWERGRLVSSADNSYSYSLSVVDTALPILLLLTLGLINSGRECAFTILACAMAYIPLSCGVWLFGRAEDTLSRFYSRSTQPVGEIKRAVNGFASAAVCVVAAAVLLVPNSAGETLIGKAYEAIMAAIAVLMYLLTRLVSLLPVFEEAAVETALEGEFSNIAPVNESGEIINSILIALVLVGVAVMLIRGLVHAFIRIYRFILRSLADRHTTPEVMVTGYDTVESIDRVITAQTGQSGSGSPAEKVRQIYRKKVCELKKEGLCLHGCETTDDIADAAKEIGKNIDALTCCYKKARYTQNCSAEDLAQCRKAARQ